ncbi:hypothetical protein [Pseudomonas sp. FEN]|nr:hypothetical protein [Pseudomonas sp. FEN]
MLVRRATFICMNIQFYFGSTAGLRRTGSAGGGSGVGIQNTCMQVGGHLWLSQK